MENNELMHAMRSAIDTGLRSFIDKKMQDVPENFKEMIRYQLGWSGVPHESLATGKRIRPTLVLLVCHALGGDWRQALAAAAGVELLHNFTLIHDDIQDRSLTRRGRDAVWVKWGEAQAINAGDALYALACSAAYDLTAHYPADVVLAAVEELHRTAFRLTCGQYLDMAFEKAEAIEMEDYWQMIRGKTGELIGSCFSLGALLAGQKANELRRFRKLGLQIGIAFQVQDDWLGIWGNQDILGKSVQSDLRDRKKTFPILLALKTLPEFRDYWNSHTSFSDADIQVLMKILDGSQINEKAQEQFEDLYQSVVLKFNEIFEGKSTALQLRSAVEELFVRSR